MALLPRALHDSVGVLVIVIHCRGGLGTAVFCRFPFLQVTRIARHFRPSAKYIDMLHHRDMSWFGSVNVGSESAYRDSRLAKDVLQSLFY